MQKIKVIIPSGGDGVRFKEKGYKELKPFIKFCGKTMFEHLINGFKSKKYQIDILIIIRDEFKERYSSDIKYLESSYPNVKFVYIDKKTEGTTATALHFFDYLNDEHPVLLANCDQIIDIDLDSFLDKSLLYDGSLLVFDNEHSNKWSFVELDNNNLIKRVVAKENISDLAVCGWYFWSNSKNFIKYGIEQIVTQTKVGGEYYLCPVFNFAIRDNLKITPIIIKKSLMHGVGTPDDLEVYLSLVGTK